MMAKHLKAQADLMAEVKALDAETEALSDEDAAIRVALDRIKARRLLEGPAVKIRRREERQAIERRRAEWQRRSVAHAKRREHVLQEAEQALLNVARSRKSGIIGWIVRRHSAWGVLAGLVVPGSFIAVTALKGNGADVREPFYAATVQVIPLLLVAIAIEGRILERTTSVAPIIGALYATLLVWVLAGEVAGLVVLAGESGSALLFGITVAALGYGAIMLALVAIDAWVVSS